MNNIVGIYFTRKTKTHYMYKVFFYNILFYQHFQDYFIFFIELSYIDTFIKYWW